VGFGAAALLGLVVEVLIAVSVDMAVVVALALLLEPDVGHASGALCRIAADREVRGVVTRAGCGGTHKAGEGGDGGHKKTSGEHCWGLVDELACVVGAEESVSRKQARLGCLNPHQLASTSRR